ncbi:acetoacetate--CoA ligase [Desulfopila aestuarii]|uniref:Acetoacetyl-CoA synthetase n=1 Tax=Desulfopila aestuarii DSM 18488 TaxID=1121416 RepID=A0A1M7XVW9_9BACT|nr:acetoacetate--CoA ligase [Desulfopila aestuarii]SHO42560.1 acetoacetyl-CoA synthetase [Desulfopila aestuarii DSM 18488]
MELDGRLWTPSPERIANSLLMQFMDFVADKTGNRYGDYPSLHVWSTTEPEQFWSLVWDFCGVIGDKGETVLVDGHDIEHARWFPEAQLNFAENLLRRCDETPAMLFRAEDKLEYSLSYRQLHQQVGAVSAWLRSIDIRPGDRVAGYLPNMPETVVAMLATASVGAIWTSTSPDFGYESVVDRFGQTTPKVLFAADGYFYNGKTIDLRERVERIGTTLTTLRHIVIIPLTGESENLPGMPWRKVLERFANTSPIFTPMGFNDPLCIFYSSGTTGKPKCITHKTGGVLLQHLKEHQLQCDIHPGDRVFYFTTCGWMMWNWLASSLASQATLVLYDGSPFAPDDTVLWRYADEARITLFGTSAKYIDTIKKREVRPKELVDLQQLRTICSTGSVLAPESFDYVYEAIKKDVNLASISGGTDIISCFIIGCPILPVYRGEIQCAGLGMTVDVVDQNGESILDEKGELVCRATFPSQPIYFWNDPDGQKYHNAYFARFDNIWHHGDYVKRTRHNGFIIYGRSDATLNPGGVRIGTAEIYRHVEQLEEVLEAIVVGQEWENDQRVILFVVLQPGHTLDEKLTQKIRKTILEKCSPRHVPARVIQVDAIPRTKSGKIVELAVREVIHEREVKNITSLANPEALELYRDLPELR